MYHCCPVLCEPLLPCLPYILLIVRTGQGTHLTSDHVQQVRAHASQLSLDSEPPPCAADHDVLLKLPRPKAREQFVTINLEQAVRLILMKEKADRIRKARLQQ